MSIKPQPNAPLSDKEIENLQQNNNNNKSSSGAALDTAPIGSLLFKLALPAIAAQIINVLYNMVDRMYIGHIPDIGPSALTGVGVTMPIIMCISAFASLAAMGGAPQASILMGKGDKNAAEDVLGNCTFMLTVISIVLTILFLSFGRSILLMFGASKQTITYAWDYMKIYVCGTFFVQMALGLNAFINAQGYAKTGMITVAIGALCNIVLDPIFIFGFNMDVRGAALATIISQGISCIWILRFLTGEHSTLKISFQKLRPQKKYIIPCLALGLAPFIMQFTESALSISFNTSLLKYGGDTAVGAMTILSSVMQFSMLPLHGLTQGAQPIISFNYGAKNINRVKKAFFLLLKAASCYSGILWLLCMIVPQIFISIFTNDAELTAYTIWAIRIYMAASLLFAIQISCQQTFIALGNAKTSVFLALLRKVLLLIPLIFILPHLVSNPVFGVFVAEPIADTIAVMTTATLFSREYKKLK